MRSIGDILDVIVEPRYDTNLIPAAGTTQLTYFALPIGQGLTNFNNVANSTKTLADTNMDLAGQLPAGYNFVVLGFRVQPSFWISNINASAVAAATSNGTDANTWSHGGVFNFTIGSKPFLRVPLDTIPAGMGVLGGSGVFTAMAAAASSYGWPALSNSFSIGRQPLELAQTQNFLVSLTWATAVANLSASTGGAASAVSNIANTNIRAAGIIVRVYMDGYLKRIVQ